MFKLIETLLENLIQSKWLQWIASKISYRMIQFAAIVIAQFAAIVIAIVLIGLFFAGMSQHLR